MKSSNTSRQFEQLNMPSMTCLSNEILLMTFELLPKMTLRKVSQVCRNFHDMATPILFRAIDLSIYPIIDLDNRQQPSHWPIFAQWILVLQWRFAKQIALNPVYASFVRTFKWTMGLEHHFECHDRGIKEDFDLNLIYFMFTNLTKATHINIDTGCRLPEAIPQLPALFPAAKHINLGGKMHYTLATSILHGESKTSLISLTLDNIVEGGLIYDPETKQSVRFLRSEASFARSQHCFAFKEMWPANRPPKQILPGPMRRLLTSASFQRRCRGLQYLCLRKQGQQHPGQYLPSRELTHDLDVYDEWAFFIRIIKPKVLLMAHLGSLEQQYYWKKFRLPSHQNQNVIEPMDAAFRGRLSPVLMQPWEGLKRLEVHGVDRRVLPTSLERFDGVDVIIDEEVLPCWNAEAGANMTCMTRAAIE